LENDRGYLRRAPFFAARYYADVAISRTLHLVRYLFDLFSYLVVAASHESLDGVHRILRVGNCLTFCDLSHQAAAILSESNHRRGGSATFGIGDNRGLATFHDRDHGVGGSQIDSNNLAHLFSFSQSIPQLSGRRGPSACRTQNLYLVTGDSV